MLLMTEPSGARLPRGNVTVEVRPRSARRLGAHDDVVGIDAVALAQQARAARRRRSDLLHQSSDAAERFAGHGQAGQIEQAESAQVQHHLGHAAGQEDAHRRMADRAVGQRIDQARHPAVDGGPVLDRRPAQPGVRKRSAGMCSSRFVEPPNAAWTVMALRKAASVRMCCVCDLARLQIVPRPGPSGGPCRARSVGRTAPGAECGSDRPSASPTTCDVAAVPRNWQPPPGEAQARQPSSAACSSVISPCAKRAPMVCTLPASSPSVGGSVTPPGTRTHGRSCMPARAIIIAGSPLSQVATPMTPRARRQRTNQPAQHHGRIVAIRQAIHHADGALRAAVARIGAEAGERHAAEPSNLLGRRLHEQPDFPMAGVIAQSDRRCRRQLGARRECWRMRNSRPAEFDGIPDPCRRFATSRIGRRTERCGVALP